jgi:DNA integrity scanning protein DisA with diadenylate cyclase activity
MGVEIALNPIMTTSALEPNKPIFEIAEHIAIFLILVPIARTLRLPISAPLSHQLMLQAAKINMIIAAIPFQARISTSKALSVEVKIVKVMNKAIEEKEAIFCSMGVILLR